MTAYKDHDIDQLKALIAEKRESLRTFRHASAGSRTRNVREGRTVRKEIARILTELRARTLASLKKSA